MLRQFCFVLVFAVVDGLAVVPVACFELVSCDAYVSFCLVVVGCCHVDFVDDVCL